MIVHPITFVSDTVFGRKFPVRGFVIVTITGNSVTPYNKNGCY